MGRNLFLQSKDVKLSNKEFAIKLIERGTLTVFEVFLNLDYSDNFIVF